jgi:lysophospholipase L1-like esterase
MTKQRVCARISSFCTRAAYDDRMAATVTIIALGDSTTAGSPAFKSPIEAPPDGSGNVESQYAYWLTKRHPDWRVLNRGVDGERSDEIRARFTRDVVQAEPDVVVILAGVNDVYQGRSAESVEGELEAMYDLARAARISVVAGSIIPYNTATPEQNARMRAVNRWIRDYADRHDGSVTFCDTRTAVAEPGQPDRLVSSPDDLHPSPDGYRLMADALEPAIRTALAKAHALR